MLSGLGSQGRCMELSMLTKKGNCVSPLYTWQDARGSICDGDQIPLTEEIRERCKIHAASGYGLVTHIYNIRHNLVPDSALSFCTIMDYFGMHLTERKKPLVHVSNAAGLGFFDSRKMCFEKEKLAEMGVDVNWLPDVCTEIAKNWVHTEDGQLQLQSETTRQASLAQQVMRRIHYWSIWEPADRFLFFPVSNFAGDGIEARPFLNGKYLLAGASLCGGKAYALLEQVFPKNCKRSDRAGSAIIQSNGKDGKNRERPE